MVSPRVFELRSQPDFRIARRALIISRLAQVISERKVQGGLRRVLQTQAKRLQWLAERRYLDRLRRAMPAWLARQDRRPVSGKFAFGDARHDDKP